MKRTLALAVTLGLVAAFGSSPANAVSPRQQPAARTASVAAPAAPAVRQFHAVLRYDASTAASCRSFSDTPSELCLLLALHIIQMSEKPLPAGAL